jgi:hypothetical protein
VIGYRRTIRCIKVAGNDEQKEHRLLSSKIVPGGVD